MTTGKVKVNKGITIGVLLALLLSLSVSAENNHEACTEITSVLMTPHLKTAQTLFEV